jgi:hypothetical protein
MTHPNARLEALSDGVFAIAMTLLILDIRLPHRRYHQHRRAVAGLAASDAIRIRVHPQLWRHIDYLGESSRRATSREKYIRCIHVCQWLPAPHGCCHSLPNRVTRAFLQTNQAAPAVVLYNATLALVAVGWILVTGAAVHGHLTSDGRTP